MPLWNEVLSLLNQESLFLENIIVEKTVIDETAFLFKIRSVISDNLLFQIRYRQSADEIRYSFQLFSTKPIMRWDNAPYFPGLENFPHHFHNETDAVMSSNLTGNVLLDIKIVLSQVKAYCVSELTK